MRLTSGQRVLRVATAASAVVSRTRATEKFCLAFSSPASAWLLDNDLTGQAGFVTTEQNQPLSISNLIAPSDTSDTSFSSLDTFQLHPSACFSRMGEKSSQQGSAIVSTLLWM